jgi:hypothetical protein
MTKQGNNGTVMLMIQKRGFTMRGKVNEMLRKVTAGTVAVVLLSFLAGTLSAQVGTRVGNFMYKGNAVRLNTRTIDVSDSMTAISNTFWSDVSKDSFVVNNETPSIMFVIDNSGSMGVNTPHNDRDGQRFVITRQFLDTIYLKYPAAEVGLAVFGTHLYFDTLDKATHQYFTQTNPLYQHDPAGTNRGAYVRLLRLDSTYVNYGNLTGYTILRNILDTAHYTGRDFNNNNYNFVGLRYLPTTPTLGGINDAQGWPYTNITAGFDAAKSAMDAATASRCSRYIIFLSDGDANRPTGAAQWYFRDNTANVPTTFTVFFPNVNPPASIVTMTNNIRVNGYDLSHPADSGCQGKSDYWSANAGDLMGTLSNQIWDLITTSTQTRPASTTVNGFTSTQRLGDSLFIFNNFIPLTGQITPVSVSTTYDIIVNNVRVGDTTITVSDTVRTMLHGNPTFPNWNPSKADSFQVWTWDRDFSFRYNSVRHDTITGTMDSVELYFTFDSGTAKYGYDNVYIDLYNKIAPIDHQRIPLTRVSDRVFSGKFKRQVTLNTANVDELPALLQYRGANDSIIAVFRNREQLTTGKVQLPLDTLRKSIGFVNVTMNIAVNDTIITAGDTTNRIKIASSYVGDGAVDSTWIKNNLTYLQLPLNKRPGDTVVRTTGQWARFTGTMADTVNARRIECALYLPDGQVLRDTILVRIRPAAASRLWIEADNTPDPYVTNPFGVMTFTSTMTLDSAWAVLRDKYNNLVSFSTSTAWLSRNTTVVTVREVPAHATTGEGEVTKGALVASTWVLATNNVNTSLRDSIQVVITDISYDSLMILRYIGGTLTPIYNLRDTIPNASTIYVQAHRADGLGGHNGWGNDVAGTWSLSASLSGKTSSLPPSSSNSWTFTPNDTGTGIISVSLAGVSTPATLNPVVFVVGAPNLIYIYPVSGMPNVPGNTVYPAAPSVIDTMCSDSAFSRLCAKLFYRTAGGKEIWLSTGVLDNPTLGSQITWSANGTRDTMTPTYGNFSKLTARQAYRVSTVTARWNALSYSVNIYIEACNPDHIVIEATPVVVNLIADDPVAQLTIQSQDTSAVAYARIRDHYGNYISPSINSAWSSSNNAVIIGRKGDPATGEGIAVRRADGGSALLIASDSVARPGFTMRDSVLVNLSIIYYQDLRIYTLVPSYNPNVDSVTIPIADSLTLYAEGQRSDDPSRWEAVMVRWGKDMTLNTVTNPSGTAAFSWTVIPSTIGTGRIRAAFSQTGYQDLHDSVWAVFTEGPADSIGLYQSLGNPAVVPVFPAIDTIAAGSTDSVFAKIFDRTGQWLRRFEDTVALAQATISWTIQKVSGPGNDPLNILTGRMTTFSPHTAFTTYRVTATFSQSGTIRTASALIYVSRGAPDHIVIEAQVGTAVESSVADNPLPQVSLGPYDTTYTQVYAIIRDRDGNFYGYSHNPDWWSADLSIVTAVKGTAWYQYGQGKIIRVTPNTGSTFVMAMDLDYPSLKLDSVPVVLGSVPYDSLRITLRHPTTWMDTVEIHGIVYMQSGDANTFYVQARRAVVNTWEDVSSDWRYVATLGSKTGPTAHGWPFTAVDTAHYGIMTATFGPLSASITIAIDAGVANSLVFYTDSLPPGGGNVPKANPPLMVTVAAGSRDTVAALVFDSRGVFLPQYLTGSERLTISWTATSRSQAFLNEDLSAKLLGAPGPVKYFAPTRAYDTVLIVATLNTLMRDSVLVVVQPGPAYHIVLEKTPAYDRHAPNPCDTLTIQENEQGKSVYAILRDQYDNVVSPAYAALIRDSVRSANGFIGVNIPGTIGQLQVQRLGLSDSGMIYAWDSHGFSDSCVVILRPYRIIALRIVSAPNTPYADGDTLTMTNNDSAAIYVEGRRSNDSLWVSVEATWEILPRIQPVLPGNGRYSQSFMVSPTDTGTGWVRVTKGNYDQTTPDTLPLHFTGGGAVRAKITILTPAAQRIAGQPIVAVDSLFDGDNHLIRSLPPVTAAYHDTIGRGGLMRPEPSMLVTGGTGTVYLDRSPWGSSGQTFTGGVSLDTFTLYYAPAAPVSIDSMHRISASFTTGGRVLPAQTESFILLPGPLSSIIMESNGVPIVDTIKLYYGGGQTSENIFTRGYDPYSNNLGFVPTNWSVSDSLHPIAYGGGNSVTNVNYSTTDPTFTGRDEGGWIRAQAPSNPAIYDRVPVFIFGPLIRLDSAITGDWSGNGLLDHMTLHFSRPFVPRGPDFEGLSIKLSGTTFDFTPDTASYAILNNTGSSSAIWVLSLVERNSTTLQTGWTPRVHINTQQNGEGRVIVDSTTITSLDGAGPVISSVIEYRYSNAQGDRTRDTVIVTFSEAVKRRSDHNDLQQSDMPGDIFHVWTDSTGTVMSDNLKLAGINNQFTTPTPVVVTFLMLNGNDLNGRNLLNIDSVNKYVVDAVPGRYNAPNDNNQKVRVVVKGKEGPLLPIPNPASPYIGYPGNGPGQFNMSDNPQAPGWADVLHGGHGGAAFSFDFPNPVPGVALECWIKIYDMVGNVVQAGLNRDYLSTITNLDNQGTSTGLITSYLYWNGTNARGMVVAPGVYRVVLYLHFKDEVPGSGLARQYADEKKVSQVGISR